MKFLGYEINIRKSLPVVPSGGGRDFVTPPSWMNSYLGPGQPIRPITPANQIEVPRSIDYPISVNAQLTPRSGFGLKPFAEIMLAYEKVPECRFPVNLIHRQLSSYQPRLINKQGMRVEDHDYQWMCEYPDGRTPFSVWMTRYLKSAKIYDAPALYIERDASGIIGLHFIDGSTLFVILDERGNTPMPERPQEYIQRTINTYASSVDGVPVSTPLPGATRGPSSIDSYIAQYNGMLSAGRDVPLKMPAYTQVIKGTPFSWWSSDDIWYMPESRRVNAPYGEPFIEAAWPWVMIIVNLTAFELAHYRTGNMPEGYVTLPTSWLAGPDQLEALELALNQRMTLNPVTERNRIRLFPDGAKWFQTKRGEWPESLYNRARGNILDEIGIPPAEAGDIPGQGLGGKGFKEGGTTELNRNTINPNRNTILAPFNHMLKLEGVRDVAMTLEPPIGEIDPEKLKQTVYDGMAHGTYSLNDGRSLLNMQPIGDPDDPKNIANLHLIVAGSAIYVIEDMEISQGMAVPSFTGQKAAAPPAGPETAVGEPEHVAEEDVKTLNKLMRQVLDTGTLTDRFFSFQKINTKHDDHGRFATGGGGVGGVGPGALDEPTEAADEAPPVHHSKQVKTRNFKEFKPATEYAQKLANSHAKNLLPEEKDAAERYYGVTARPLNDYLRSGKAIPEGLDIDTDKVTKHLDSAISKSTLPEPVITYKGMSSDPGLKKGDVFKDKGFVSTTLSKDLGESFATRNPGSGSVFEIRLPKGSKALSMNPPESELVLPRNSSFVVKSSKKISVKGKQVTKYILEPGGDK